MPIKFYLQPNLITPDPLDQSARVAPNSTLDLDAIVEHILKRGTLVTATDARAVLNIFFDVVSDEVADGNAVLLPLINLKPSIKGVFTTIMDGFDSSRHTIKASVTAGTLLNEKMSAATVEKITATQPMPVLLEFTDINSKTINGKLTAGGMGQIVGEELKFNPDNAAEGVYLVNSTGAATKMTVFATRTEGKLLFGLPATIAKGNYTLEVRKGYGKAAAIRTGVLKSVLKVS